LDATGNSPKNVDCAVKSSFLLSFLESIPDALAKFKRTITVDQKFDNVVQSSQSVAVLMLVY
jgi:hypothetical protein